MTQYLSCLRPSEPFWDFCGIGEFTYDKENIDSDSPITISKYFETLFTETEEAIAIIESRKFLKEIV